MKKINNCLTGNTTNKMNIEQWNKNTINELIKSGVIEEILDGNHGNIHPKSSDYVENGIPFIMASDINKGKLDIFNCKYISEKTSKRLKKGFAKEGDLLLTHKGTVGQTAIVPKLYCDYIVLTPQVTYYRLNKKNKVLDIKYLKYYFESESFQLKLKTLGAQSTRAYVGITEQKKLDVIFPDYETQLGISSILSTWDLAIEKQAQLIEKKKEFKKGLIQRLLSGEVRFKEFNDKWKKARLDKYIEPISRECDKPSEGYWRLGLRSHGKGTFHEFVDDPTKVSMDKLYKVKCNDLIVNITFAWEHAIAVAKSEDEGKLVSHRFPTYKFKENAYPEYFKYYILQSTFRKMLVNISPGGAGRNRVMNRKDFLKLEVLIPSYDEQKRIAEVLISVDKEIELLEKELEALKLQKKGLMQKLLTGEVRVKV